MKIINPFNNQLIKEYNDYGSNEIHTIIKSKDLSQRQWR